MNIHICDYCGERGFNKLYQIKLTNRPNDEEVYAELCGQCIGDIKKYEL